MTQDRDHGRVGAGPLDVCWFTDVGRVRETNEDACLALPDQGLLIVSDGMGGEPAGEVASELVVKWLPGLVAEHLDQLARLRTHAVEHALQDALVAVNHRLREEISAIEGLTKMGATVALVLLRDGHAHVAHMGDSRVYLQHGRKLQPLTRDHSVVGLLLQRKLITPEQAEGHAMRGQLSRYVGMGGEARPDLRTVRVRPGDRLLLCTDGLTGFVPDDLVAEIMVKNEEPAEACRALVEAANIAGGKDNITVMIAEWARE